MVKRRRKIKSQESKLLKNPSTFTGLDSIAGPSDPQVLTPVKSVRRRLQFDDDLLSADTSSESSDIPNPFTDSEEDIELTELLPSTTSTPVKKSLFENQELITTHVPTTLDVSVMLEELAYAPAPHSPLPVTQLVVPDKSTQHETELSTATNMSLSPDLISSMSFPSKTAPLHHPESQTKLPIEPYHDAFESLFPEFQPLPLGSTSHEPKTLQMEHNFPEFQPLPLETNFQEFEPLPLELNYLEPQSLALEPQSTQSQRENSPALLPIPVPEHNLATPIERTETIQPTDPHQNIIQGQVKHPVLRPCTCKMNCITKLPEERRLQINLEFWTQPYTQRRNWMFQHRPAKDQKKSHSYLLPTHLGELKNVCQLFFLRTLGYSSNSVLRSLDSSTSAGELFTPEDKRGKHKPRHATPDRVIPLIDEHIESFHPAVSHYRRAHAPNRRYLSPELTVRDMHSLFKELHPHIRDKVGYDTYRRRLVLKNISFSKLGNEQCELCLEFSHHEHQLPSLDLDCETCRDFKMHKDKAEISREHYERDKEKDPQPGTELYMSADMQKVIMLPCMPGVKTCVFTNRLVAFHETFAPMGQQAKKRYPKQVIAVMWHEAISGRSAADVTSAFVKAIHEMSQDARDIVIWCDNCSGQNKNWYLFTSLVRVMNSNNHPLLHSVTLKYLETGHTFLSCDSFHGLVEKNMRKRGIIHNFKDLVAVVQTAGGGPKILEMDVSDFREWNKRVTGGKTVTVPKLRDIQVARFQQGSKTMFFKLSHNDKVFEEVDFIMKRTQKDMDRGVDQPKCRQGPRGIPVWKKNGIVTNLCRLMPDTKQVFWNDLPTNEASTDLTENDDRPIDDDPY